MFGAGTIITTIASFMGLLVLAAYFTERRLALGKDPTNNGVVYALSMGIFYSAWTYYGSVGLAARSGFLFFTFYIGATLAAMLWWIYLRKLVRIKNEFRLTSIADFVAARYGKSQLIAALITITIIVGIAPYIALQLKAVRTTYTIIAAPLPTFHWIGRDVTPIVVMFMIAFTIIFGVRHVDPTKRHAGMVMSVALESLIQLIFFLIAGIFVVFIVFDGFGDIFHQLRQSGLDIKMPLMQTASPFLTWVTYIVLAMAAVVFLPRQFHIGVVELGDEKNIRPAMWLFPLYTFLTTLFMFPIAMAGLLKGLPLETADTYVLAVPARYGCHWISLLIFIGGFAAATSMIMISSMTLGTMITNHLVLPIIGVVPGLQFLQRRLLWIKRSAVALVIISGYAADIMLGDTYALVSIGIMSFVVAAQFAPALVGGIFWRRASKAGAVLGIGSGVFIWFYTILTPAFARSGWIPMSLVNSGPWGIELLRPEQLFGVSGMHPIVHGTMWSLLFNSLLYVMGSLYFGQKQDERRLANSFVDILAPKRASKPPGRIENRQINLFQKIELFQKKLGQFLTHDQTREIIDAGLEKAAVQDARQISVLDLAEIVCEIQNRLGGAIGSAAAHKLLNDAAVYTADEFRALNEAYTTILLSLKVSPEEVMSKIDYHRERENLLSRHAEALQGKVRELKGEVAARKRAEAALQKNKEQLEIILESSPDPVVVNDDQGRTVFVNQAFTRVFGWRFDEVRGQSIPFIPDDLKDDGIQDLHKIMTQDGVVSFGTQRFTKTGRRLDVVISASKTPEQDGRNDQVIVNLRDITEELRMKAQVQQTQKMQALGTLAGGIAHDFNNILMAMIGYTELALDVAQEGTLQKENLQDVLLCGQRAKELVQQILTFSRQSNHEPRPIKIKPYVLEALNLIRSSLPRTIQIRRDLRSDALVNGDAIQIHQVVMNLCANAGHAMGKNGGVLDVALEDIEIDSEFAAGPADLKPGAYIRLSVCDTGCGMPPEVLGRIFEPFYTTKAEGEGSGMGLSVVHGIVKSHGGEIVLDSVQGRGTRATVFLPSIQSPARAIMPVDTITPRGSERILFVDDETMIARMGKRLLETLGYTVTMHTSSVEAFEVFKTTPHQFDLVISDVTMPNLTGDELAGHIKTIRPEIPIILCTGFSDKVDQKQAEKVGVQSFLFKPISKNEMAWQIRSALDRTPN